MAESNDNTEETPGPLSPADLLNAQIQAITHSDGDEHVLAFASSDSPIARNALVNILSELDSKNDYEKMATSRKYSDRVALVHRLSHWRADLWGRGFELVHPHSTVQQAYRAFAAKFNLALQIPKLMRDLSIVNNGCIIWASGGNGSTDLAYFNVYSPESTRIDIITDTLWVSPGDDLKTAIDAATPEQIKAYIEKRKLGDEKHTKKWVEAIKDPYSSNAKFQGFIPLKEEDDEYWQIILGSGGSSSQSYSTAAMQTIFTDIELLKMLIEGDWATAFLLKNIIMIVKVGESIQQGALSGSRKNWAKQQDVDKLKDQVEKTGKAQILYGNHTITIEFAHPEPTVFSPDKYDAVIDRICTYFGIGQFMILGKASGSSSGASYAAASWNVQEVRMEATAKREIVDQSFRRILSHDSIVKAVFRHKKDIYWHNCFSEVDGKALRFSDGQFRDLSKANIGILQYSKDQFATTKDIEVVDVYSDISTVVVANMPKKAEPEQFRLFLTPAKILALQGPVTTEFDGRGLKEDRQRLAEVEFAIGQGMTSVLTGLKELGWKFDAEMAQKAREKSMQELLFPVFEKNQGLVMAMIQAGLNQGMEMVDENGQPKKAPGEPGRPTTDDGGNQPTGGHPRPSTASADDHDFASMSEEELSELKTAVWESLENVPARLKTLHGVPLTLSQINAIAKQAEGAERGGADSGWAVARAHFLDTHIVRDGSWVKKKTK